MKLFSLFFLFLVSLNGYSQSGTVLRNSQRDTANLFSEIYSDTLVSSGTGDACMASFNDSVYGLFYRALDLKIYMKKIDFRNDSMIIDQSATYSITPSFTVGGLEVENLSSGYIVCSFRQASGGVGTKALAVHWNGTGITLGSLITTIPSNNTSNCYMTRLGVDSVGVMTSRGNTNTNFHILVRTTGTTLVEAVQTTAFSNATYNKQVNYSGQGNRVALSNSRDAWLASSYRKSGLGSEPSRITIGYNLDYTNSTIYYNDLILGLSQVVTVELINLTGDSCLILYPRNTNTVKGRIGSIIGTTVSVTPEQSITCCSNGIYNGGANNTRGDLQGVIMEVDGADYYIVYREASNLLSALKVNTGDASIETLQEYRNLGNVDYSFAYLEKLSSNRFYTLESESNDSGTDNNAIIRLYEYSR